MALRAVADGHENQSHMVRDPVLWGYSKIKGMAEPYLKAA